MRSGGKIVEKGRFVGRSCKNSLLRRTLEECFSINERLKVPFFKIRSCAGLGFCSVTSKVLWGKIFGSPK